MQKRLFRRLAGLAAMLAVCTTAGYYLLRLLETVLPEKQECPYHSTGRLQARLILSDGSTVLLDSSTVERFAGTINQDRCYSRFWITLRQHPG